MVYDTDTGTLSRAGFEVTAEHVFARARREGEPVSIVRLDITRWGSTTERKVVLLDLGGLLHKELRASDVIGRTDKRQLAVLLPATDEAGAALVISHLSETLRAYNDDLLASARFTVELRRATYLPWEEDTEASVFLASVLDGLRGGRAISA